MNLEIGSKKRFLDFVSALDEKDKIALVSHTDLDGIASAKVANKVIGADELRFVGYGELNMDLVEDLRRGGFNKVIFTDLFIEGREFIDSLESFSEILILDHHRTKEDVNSEKTVFIKSEDGYCAAYLCYKLFSEIEDIEKIDWLVACACISDFCNIKNMDWMKEVFSKYGSDFDDFSQIGFRLDNINKTKFHEIQWALTLALVYFDKDYRNVFDGIGESFGDIGGLRDHASEVQDEINRVVEKFENERQEFNGGYFFSFNPKFRIASITSNVLSQKYPEKTLILAREDRDYYNFSARRQDGRADMNVFTRKLVEGLDNANAGGHVPAAGGRFQKKDIEEFKKRLGVMKE
jgi:single-stranded DNA-specific DHH superfamily exonuclease